MITRRDLIRRMSTLPFLGGFMGQTFRPEALAAAPARNLAKELGIRTFINAAGTYTAMTGSLMEDDVVEAIKGTSREFMMLDEVQD